MAAFALSGHAGRFAKAATLGLALAAWCPAHGQQPELSSEDILVVGVGGKPLRVSPEQLKGAVRAFWRDRPTLAPAASLRWRFVPAASAKGVALWLKSADETLPVTIDDDGSFELPSDKILQGNVRLVASGARGKATITPVTWSPGSSSTDFRFGDARLICQVFWGFLAPSTNFMLRGLFGLAGGCRSKRFGIYFSNERPIRQVTIANWGHSVVILPDRSAWRVPLYDRTISNEARVHIVVD